MFESQYNDELEAEVKRLEAQMRAINAGHPEWINACSVCGCELTGTDTAKCKKCLSSLMAGENANMEKVTSEQQPGNNIELHTGHMCELESQQEWDIIRQITDNPKVRCENCGAEVNNARNVCMPNEI